MSDIDLAKQLPKQQIKLLQQNCPIESHANPLIGYCIEPQCKNPHRFFCYECLFESHNGHKMVKINKVDDIVNLERSKSQSLSDSKIAEFLKQVERTFAEESEKIKEMMTLSLKKATAEFLAQLNQDLFEELKSQKNSNNLEFLNYKGLKEMDQAESLALNSVIIEGVNNNNPDPKDLNKDLLPEVKIEPLKLALQGIQKALEATLVEKLKAFKPETFFSFDSRQFPLEWVPKTYSTYEFYFELSDNNKNATKVKSGGTMTIVRSKEPLEIGFLHQIEMMVTWKSTQDLDVGFANDGVGKLCWLRVPNSYGITSNGIYCSGEKKSDIGLTDGRKVRFDLNLREKPMKCKIFLDFEMVWEMNIDEKEIYLMAGMRGLKDAVKIIGYKKV